MAKRSTFISKTQQGFLWAIEDKGFRDIPHFRLDEKRTAESLRKKGLVKIELVGAGVQRVTKVGA